MLLASMERAERQPRLATLGTNDPEELRELLETASKSIQNFLDRDIFRTTYTAQLHDGTGTRELILREFPLITLTTIVVVDANEVSETFAGTLFRTELESGRIIFKPKETGSFLEGFQNIQVTYEAGYTEVPDDLQHMMILLAISLLDQLTFGTDLRRRKLGDYEEERFAGVGIPETIKRLLQPYVDMSRRF